VAMEADEDVDRRCVNCAEPCHAHARRICGRWSMQRQQDEDDNDDDGDDDEEGKDGRRMCDNCGAICNHLHDGVDHAYYTPRLCAVCLRRSCKRRLPDVNFADEQHQTCWMC